MFLEALDVHKSYPPDTQALKGVSLRVEKGEIVCLLGPSGCGKTTLLRIVAGLEQMDSGRLLLEGRDLSRVPVHKRGFGLMFQEFALFPDKSVAENVAFGLRMAGWERGATRRRVDEMLALVNLPGYGARSVFELSGGERQRVALARSLAPSPRLLMLDEPLASLDRTLRERLLDDLHMLLKQLGLTSLYVTHDQQEALAVADRVVVMQAGRIAQEGAPQEVHRAPASVFVARFLGFANLLPARVHPAAPTLAETALGPLPLAEAAAPDDYTMLIRPSALLLETPDGLPRLQGQIEDLSFRGSSLRTEISVPAQEPGGAPVRLLFDAPADAPLATGQPLAFALDPADCSLLPRNQQP